jgi:PAS domain S-box-containing protein
MEVCTLVHSEATLGRLLRMMSDCGEDIERVALTAVTEQAADAIVITDTNARIRYVNTAFTKLTGYSCDEVVGQNPRLLKSGQQPPSAYEKLWTTIRSGGVWHGELINRRKDGTLYREDMRITPVKGSNGEIVNFIAIKRDATNCGEAADGKRFLPTIAEGFEDAIVAYSPAGIILSWNRDAESIFGYSGGEPIGTHISIIVSPEHHSTLEHLTERVLQGNVVLLNEGICMRRDGRLVQVSVSAYPVKNSLGQVDAVSLILSDISERRQAEDKIREIYFVLWRMDARRLCG